jgi:hypothetical protein
VTEAVSSYPKSGVIKPQQHCHATRLSNLQSFPNIINPKNRPSNPPNTAIHHQNPNISHVSSQKELKNQQKLCFVASDLVCPIRPSKPLHHHSSHTFKVQLRVKNR